MWWEDGYTVSGKQAVSNKLFNLLTHQNYPELLLALVASLAPLLNHHKYKYILEPQTLDKEKMILNFAIFEAQWWWVAGSWASALVFC